MANEQDTQIEVTMAKSLLDLDKDDRFLAHLPADSKRLHGQAYYRLAKVFYDTADFEKAEEYFIQ